MTVAVATWLMFILGWKGHQIQTSNITMHKTKEIEDVGTRNNGNGAGTSSKASLLSIRGKTFQRGQLKRDSVIIFIHVPKTGGTTISNNIEFRSNTSMKLFTHIHGGRKMWRRGKDYIDNYLSRSRRTETENIKKGEQSVFMEIHTLAPSFVTLQDQIQAWKHNATANGKNLFVFTILREPVSWSMSAFNHYFHGSIVNDLRANPNKTTANSVLVDYCQENAQCTFLFHSWQYPKPKSHRWNPQKKNCDFVYTSLENQADFVGTTERIHDVTEMLKFLLDMPSNFTFTHENSGKTNSAGLYIGINEMSNNTLEYYKSMTSLDNDLYENARKGWSLMYT